MAVSVLGLKRFREPEKINNYDALIDAGVI
jgi:hypothetical protein